MGDFAIKGCALKFAIIFGASLAALNFALMFTDSDQWTSWMWPLVFVLSLVYIWLLIVIIREPVTALK